jgi:hypothetical protein
MTTVATISGRRTRRFPRGSRENGAEAPRRSQASSWNGCCARPGKGVNHSSEPSPGRPGRQNTQDHVKEIMTVAEKFEPRLFTVRAIHNIDR